MNKDSVPSPEVEVHRAEILFAYCGELTCDT